MIVTSFCLRHYETCFIDSVGLVFLASSSPPDPTFLTPSFHRIPRIQGNVWVGISACATISCWKNFLWWHLCWESIYDFRYKSFHFFFSCSAVFGSFLILEATKFWFLAILAVSDIGFLSQLGLKVRPVIGCSLHKLGGTFAPVYLASRTSVVLSLVTDFVSQSHQ